MQHIKETVKLLENSSVYYTIAIGMDSKYSYVSSNYDKSFGSPDDSLLGKPFQVTLHADDVIICSDVGAKCFENPTQLYPATLRKHDGKGGFVSTQWEFRALFDEEHKPAGVFCIGYNITEYVDTRNQLVTAETEIGYKTERLNEIGYMQSHVIRKPLANILGLMQVLDMMEVDENLLHIKKLIAESARELDDVIKDITEKTN